MDTLIGAIVTQIIMASVLIVMAATIHQTSSQTHVLNNVTEISTALIPLLGDQTGRILFALGMGGAALVATIVISLTLAWSMGEVLGFRRSLEDHPRDAPCWLRLEKLI